MTSAKERPAQTTDFEQSIQVNAQADNIFQYLSDVRNVPQYLPTVTNAQPQSGERIRTQGHAGDHEYDSDGHFRIDQQRKRLEWGSDGENEYGGWMEVKGNGNQSEVKVHIHYAPSSETKQHMEEQSPQHSFESAMNEGIGKTLKSIKQICEGTGGKEEISPNQ
ncbi:MAG: SRPBCC family protein [Leptolyngbya sp. Prado105]|jgi:uncharacterized membrane protein|nr:SRPBCC family protein [Leptolyngbya sp. Prado105]